MQKLIDKIIRKNYEERGLSNIADDINLEKPTLPQSKIYCGKRAFFTREGKAIIMYEDIAWTWLHETIENREVISRSCILYTKDGTQYRFLIDLDEFKWLLENYVIPLSPDVIVGYTAENENRFYETYPHVRKLQNDTLNKNRRGCGIGVLIFTLVLGIIMFLTAGEINLSGVIILVSLVIVAITFFKPKK